MIASRRWIFSAALVLAAAPDPLAAQRCSTTPTYAARRVTVGVYDAQYRRGAGRGGLVRAVRGNFSLEGRLERIDASWYERHEEFVGGVDRPVTGRAAGFAIRHSRPLLDGLAALCLVVGLNSTALEVPTESEIAHLHDELSLGVGIAVPMRLGERTRGSLLFEVQRASRRAENHWIDGVNIGAEAVAGAGIELPLGLTFAVQLAAPFYDTRSPWAPKWRRHGVPTMRLTLAYNLDIDRRFAVGPQPP